MDSTIGVVWSSTGVGLGGMLFLLYTADLVQLVESFEL